MPTQQEQIEFLRAELKKARAQAEAERTKRKQAETDKKQAERARKKAERAREKMQRRVEDKSKAIRDLKEKNKQAEDAKSQLEEKNRQVLAENASLLSVILSTSCVISWVSKVLKELGVDIPDAEKDRFEWLLKRSQADIEDNNRSVSTAFLEYLLAKGGESLEKVTKSLSELTKEAKDKPTNLAEEMADVNGSLQAEKRKTDDVMGALRKAVVEAADAHPDDETLQAAKDIALTRMPEQDQAVPKKKSLGRQVPEAKRNRRDIYEQPFIETGTCPECGETVVRIKLADACDFLRHSIGAFGKLIHEGNFQYPIVFCPSCGTVSADRTKDMPVPSSHAPGNQVASDIVIPIGNAVASGMPQKRIENLLGDKGIQLASERFLRPVAAWVGSGLGSYLIDRITDAARMSKHIGADETPFPVLQAEEQGLKPYLFVRTSVPYADKPFAIFDYMSGRSGEEIAKQLSGWAFRTINRDSYEGYVTAFRLLGLPAQGVNEQICCVHARRKFCAALNLKYTSELLQETEQGGLAQRYAEHTAPFLIATCLDAFGKIYAWERKAKQQDGESREAHLARVRQIRAEYSRVLMDKIDLIVKDLAKKYAEVKKGRWVSKRKGSGIAVAVTYWLNNRDGLRYFLSDPEVSPDSNGVERAIRATAVYKTVAFFKNSVDGAKTFCDWMTLRETAKLNGIGCVDDWLIAYHRALFEHIERYVWTERYERRKGDEQIALKIHKVPAQALEGFDFERWLPWNYVKTLSAKGRCEPI